MIGQLIIRNVAAALPGEGDFVLVDVLVKDGKFAKIVRSGSAEVAVSGKNSAQGVEYEMLDGSGLMMFPGAIDSHVHFDEPGFTHREDFAHGTQEAARGGVTTVVDMPCTSLPPITSLAALENKLNIVSSKAYIDYAFYGGISGHLSPLEMEKTVSELAPKVVGFKCYTISGMETFLAVTAEQFSKAIRLCAAAGRPLLLHAEDPDVIRQASETLARERGDKAPTWRDYYASRPKEAEIVAVNKAVELAQDAVEWLHIVHVGTAEAARSVAGAGVENSGVARVGVASAGATCETCAHYLAFDEDDFATRDAALKTAPPVKDAAQKGMLWRLLAQGDINFVTSDHAGAPDYEKFTGNPLTAYGGIPGTGTLFPYVLSEGLFAGRLALQRFLEATSGGAARRFGLDKAKGSIAVGKDADFVLVDPKVTTLLDPAKMYSKSHITPFAGMRLAGAVVGTFVRGSCVFGSRRLVASGSVPSELVSKVISADGAIVGSPGYGKFIQWGYA
ncbi:MAG TPA: amidohydrolase family protein [Spirochaetales bacterium]|nr:amidohydrolase family protein [Spirochaetales bacterium]